MWVGAALGLFGAIPLWDKTNAIAGFAVAIATPLVFRIIGRRMVTLRCSDRGCDRPGL